ncbi:MAG: CTP:molybdopterin cytidylyltransferase [Anaerolineae bacterium]|nr:MAG: CTP:molybdopterin cytidylyltransferase [Anaerolineae bacterium]
MNLDLRRALRLSFPSSIALVGAGGKTTTLYQLAREYQSEYPLVILTTSTHLGREQVRAADFHLIHHGELKQTWEQIRARQGRLCLTAEWDSQTQRWQGLDSETLQSLAQIAQENDVPLIIEADGARRRPLKAPADHEPALPPFCDSVIVVAGLAALGKPLTEEWVHRPQRFAELSGCPIAETITSEAILRVLSHPLGGRKGIPTTAKSYVLLTQAETPEAQATAKRMSSFLLRDFNAVVVAAKGQTLPSTAEPGNLPCSDDDFLLPYRLLAVHETIAGVVLAAGASSRFGKPKPLLIWRGETLVHRAARLALEAGLQPVIVVCGAEGNAVAEAVADLPVAVVQNPDWSGGQSTSIKAALHTLGEKSGGAIFLLVDQPFISLPLLQALLENHAQSLAPVIAPLVGDRRTNPVLFDRLTFPDLLRLEGDVGGRAIFGRYPPQWLIWQDERLPFDLDTPDDYRKLLTLDEDSN